MYTCCPDCETWFAVSDDQLGIANGWVRCGQCLVSFDAKVQLWSAPDRESRPVAWSGEVDRPGFRRTAAAATGSEPDAASEETAASPTESRLEPPADDANAPLESDLKRSIVSLGEVDRAVDFVAEVDGPSIGDVRRVEGSAFAGSDARGSRRADETGSVERRRRARDKAILARIERPAGRRRGSAISFVACVVLLCGLAAQVAWFRPGMVLEHVPAAVPALERFCELTRCPDEFHRRNDEVWISSRTVRPHPRLEGAVLVSATLENRANATRPFPALMLTLFGTDGRPIASREFEVDEYLKDGAFPPAGIQPGDRVEIEFEFAAPLEIALSFDLRLV